MQDEDFRDPFIDPQDDEEEKVLNEEEFPEEDLDDEVGLWDEEEE